MKRSKFAPVTFILITCLCLTFFAAACGNRLSKPENVSIDPDSYTLSWSRVDHARGYTVEATAEGTKRTQTIDVGSSRISCSLQSLDEGDYIVRVKAVGSGGYSDSRWSDEVYLNKDYYDGCTFTLISNGTEYEVSGWSRNDGDGTSVTIPAEYREKPVVGISEGAFKNKSSLTSVKTEGENLRYIGKNAFYSCTSLESAYFPDSVTEIGEGAFHNCRSLVSFDMPAGVTGIESSTFLYCRSLSGIDLGNVATIGDSAFYGCNLALTEVYIPDCVQSVGERAFAECDSLETVTVGSGLQSISSYAFQGDEKLKSVSFAVGADGESSLEEIDSYAFSGCVSLGSVTLPRGTKTIEENAFQGASSLEYVNIPESVEKIGQNAFYGTKFYAEQSGEMFVYAGKNLPEGETSDGNVLWILKFDGDCATDDAAHGHGSDAGIDEDCFDKETVGIADAAFYGAEDFDKILIPDFIRYVGDYAFYESSFQSVVFQGSTNSNYMWRETVSIGSYSFGSMPNLSILQFHDASAAEYSYERFPAVGSIGDHAFYGSTLVTDSFLLSQNLEHVGAYAFYNTSVSPDEDGITYIGTSSGSEARWVVGYDSANGYEMSVTLADGTNGVADYAFSRAVMLTTLMGLDKVTYIGEGAFYRCTSLTTTFLSESIADIPDYAFYGCTSLLGVGDFETQFRNLETVGRSAFYGCTSFTSFDFSNTSLRYIGKYAFYGCDFLRSVTLNEGLTEIDDYAFYKSGLASIGFPSTLERIGVKAFYKCESLSDIKFAESDEHELTIGDYAFYKSGSSEEDGAKHLETVTLPGNVKSVGDYAFYKCTYVSSLKLCEGVEKIGTGAFGSLAITSLRIPGSVKEIGSYAFRGCTQVTSVVIPSTVGTISEHAFYGMSGATFYTDAETYSGQWSDRMNSSYRPTVWGCELSDDMSYVVSVTVTGDTFSNIVRLDGYERLCAAPEREGYEFAGWALSPDGDAVYSADEMDGIPAGTTIYSVWREID